MKNCCRRCCKAGPILIIAGALIILAIVLPANFWWFALGAVLIAAGALLCRG